MSALPPAVRACICAPQWWRDELQGLHVMNGLNELALPDRLDGYRRIDGAPSRQWPRLGHALVHETTIVHSGVSFFGPVLVGPGCELGPHATIYGPAPACTRRSCRAAGSSRRRSCRPTRSSRGTAS
jgi:hypothetical protein